MRTISIRLDGKTIETLRDQAAENDQTISERVRSIIMEAEEREGVEPRLSAIEAGLGSLADAFREMDGLRRFRELYAQAKRSNIAVDALARVLLGDQKHAGWKMLVDKAMKDAAAQAAARKE